MTAGRLGVTVLVIGWIASGATAQAADIDYPDFTGVGGLTLNGSANKHGKTLQILDGPGEGGSAFTTRPKVATAKSFKSKFKVSMAPTNGEPGDGITFTLQPGDATALGQSGGGLGYMGIPDSVAVEFDVFPNLKFSDHSGNHVGINILGEADSRVSEDPSFSMADGKTFTVWIGYSATNERMRVFVSRRTKPKRPIVSLDVSLPEISGSRVRAGFTGGSGSQGIDARVHSWTLEQ